MPLIVAPKSFWGQCVKVINVKMTTKVVSGQDLGNSDNDVLMVINDGDDDEMIRQEYRQ